MLTKTFPLLAVLLSVCVSCGSDDEGASVLVVYDLTDAQRVGPWELTREDLSALMGLDASTEGSADFAVQIVSDARYDERTRLHLDAAGNVLLEDVMGREALVGRFLDSCTTVLQATKNLKTKRDKSVVFRAVVDGLTELGKGDGKVRRCLIYSDLEENSALSIYGHGASWIRDSSVYVRERLLDGVTVPKLDGVDVWLIHAATDPRDAERFENMASIVAGILRERGATMHIGGSYSR